MKYQVAEVYKSFWFRAMGGLGKLFTHNLQTNWIDHLITKKFWKKPFTKVFDNQDKLGKEQKSSNGMPKNRISTFSKIFQRSAVFNRTRCGTSLYSNKYCRVYHSVLKEKVRKVGKVEKK